MEVQCEICVKNYSSVKNLRAHLKKFHPDADVNEIAPTKSVDKTYKFECEFCGRHYQEEKLLKHHVKSHKACESNFDVSQKKFRTYAEFLTWKSQIEKETLSSFVLKNTVTKNSTKYIYFTCNRSGSFTSKSTGQRQLKTQGSCKVGHECSARINVTVFNKQECVVSYSFTHSHKPALEHLRLQKEDRLMVAQELSNQVPFHTILDKIRISVSPSKGLERIHLLKRKDLHNIVSQYNLDADINHTDDGTSVNIWVKSNGNRVEGDPPSFEIDQSHVVEAILPSIVNPERAVEGDIEQIRTSINCILQSVTTVQETSLILKTLSKLQGELEVLQNGKQLGPDQPTGLQKGKKRKISPQRRLIATKKKQERSSKQWS